MQHVLRRLMCVGGVTRAGTSTLGSMISTLSADREAEPLFYEVKTDRDVLRAD